MKKVTRVLAVINNIEDINLILKKSFLFANKFNAKVEVLFVYEEPIFSIEKIFKLEDDTINKEKIKNEIKKELQKFTNEDIAVFIKIDDTADQIWDLIKDDLETLVIHKFNKEISKSIISTIKQPTLFIKDDKKYSKYIILVDSLINLEELINEYKKVFGENYFIIYNFYYIPDTSALDPAITIGIDTNLEILENEEKIFNELKDELNFKGEFFVNSMLGEITLSEYINQNQFELTAYIKYGEELIFDNDFEIDLANEINSDFILEKKNAI